MSQPNDLSRSLVPLQQDSTLVAVIELSQSSWLVAGTVPGLERQPLKKLDPDEQDLLRLLRRWRDEAAKAGRTIAHIGYGAFPVAPSVALVSGLTGGLLLGAAAVAAFAGLVTDPVQRRLGLHQRRLLRLVDALERQTADPSAPAYAVHDHYAARVLDLFDWLACAHRLVHG